MICILCVSSDRHDEITIEYLESNRQQPRKKIHVLFIRPRDIRFPCNDFSARPEPLWDIAGAFISANYPLGWRCKI
ncbi:hypothetical protein [Microseira sp. BLCC-F43]|jgi:hypothetical protein|uniref:hypothetical protein n=1 Tax=Microseira sp. BLCC-F43 TaxID=3153602 RepID=UPI0035B700F9